MVYLDECISWSETGQDEYENDGFIVDDEEQEEGGDSDEEMQKKRRRKKRSVNSILSPWVILHFSWLITVS